MLFIKIATTILKDNKNVVHFLEKSKMLQNSISKLQKIIQQFIIIIANEVARYFETKLECNYHSL